MQVKTFRLSIIALAIAGVVGGVNANIDTPAIQPAAHRRLSLQRCRIFRPSFRNTGRR